MFRIECYCEDKKLHLVLTALRGLIHPNPSVQPVAEMSVSDGKLVGVPDGTMTAMLLRHISKHKITEIRPSEVRTFLKAQGWSQDSATHCLKEAVKKGYLRKTGKSNATKYLVNAARI